MLARQLLEHARQSLPRRLHTVVAVRDCHSRYMTAKLGQAHGCVGSECDHAPQFLLVELAIRIDVELVEEFLDADRVALRDVVEVLLLATQPAAAAYSPFGRTGAIQGSSATTERVSPVRRIAILDRRATRRKRSLRSA